MLNTTDHSLRTSLPTFVPQVALLCEVTGESAESDCAVCVKYLSPFARARRARSCRDWMMDASNEKDEVRATSSHH